MTRAEEWKASRGHLAVRSQETTRFLLDKYPISGISAADVERVMSALTARGLAADHYRPAGYEYLRAALARAAAGEPITDRWERPTLVDEPAALHD